MEVLGGGGQFLMSEVPLYSRVRPDADPDTLPRQKARDFNGENHRFGHQRGGSRSGETACSLGMKCPGIWAYAAFPEC